MMTEAQARAFATSSARMAVDQAAAYGGLQNSIDAYRQNVRDTLKEDRSDEHEAAAFDAYDGEVTIQLSLLLA